MSSEKENLSLPKYSKQPKYVHPVISRVVFLFAPIIIPFSFLYGMDLGVAIGLLVAATQITLGTYVGRKRRKEGNSFELVFPKKISTTLKNIGLACLGIGPWAWQAIFEANWGVSKILLIAEIPLIGLGMMMNRKKYLYLYHDALECGGLIAYWNQVYRVELFPDRLKLFYGEGHFIIIDLGSLSQDHLKTLLDKLELEIEKNQIHALRKSEKGEINEERYAANAKVELWD